MAAKKENSEPKKPSPGLQCKYYEATLATDANGDVIKGLEIDKQSAIDRRKNGHDVVVCGPDRTDNKDEASSIEQAASGVTNVIFHPAHVSAGANSLRTYPKTHFRRIGNIVNCLVWPVCRSGFRIGSKPLPSNQSAAEGPLLLRNQ